MYCSSCGSAVPSELSFCNRCGLDLRPKQVELLRRSGPSPELLVWGIVATTAIGFGALLALMVVMKEVLHFSEGVMTVFMGIAFATFLMVDMLFAGLLIKSKQKESPQPVDVTHLKEVIRAELRSAQTTELGYPLGTVTDQTTRHLEPVRAKQETDVPQ